MNRKEFEEFKKTYTEIQKQAIREVLNEKSQEFPIKVTLECAKCCNDDFISPKKLCKKCVDKIKEAIKNFKKNNE